MTLAMNCNITFPANDDRQAINLTQVNAVHFESSWQTLTDTAEIVLPRNVHYFDRHDIKNVFKRGDAVIVKLGYDGTLIKEFTGYITQVSADIPIKIKCQDEMYKIKPIGVNFSSPGIDLSGLLKQLVPGHQIDALEGADLGAVRFSQTTVGEVLEKLQQQMKLYTYVKPAAKEIVSGKVYADNDNDAVEHFDLERNVVSNNLDYKRAGDVHVKVKGTAINRGEKLEYSYGDDNADKNIDWQFTVKSQKALEKAVKHFYEMNKRDGFDGSFVSYGIPSIAHGSKVHLTSSLYPDREGVYYVDAVKKSFSKNGYRQEISLGNRYE